MSIVFYNLLRVFEVQEIENILNISIVNIPVFYVKIMLLSIKITRWYIFTKLSRNIDLVKENKEISCLNAFF